VEPTTTVFETVNLLTDKSILSVPVLGKFNGGVECLGFVTVFDLMLFLLDTLDKYLAGAQPNIEALNTTLRMSDICSILNQKDSWASFTASNSLLDTLEKFSNDVHRAPIWSANRTDIVGIITQSDIVGFLDLYKTDQSLVFAMSSKISELGYTSEIFTASAKESIFNVMKMMRDKKLAAIPLTNDRQEVVGCLSATDLKTLPVHNWPRVFDDAQDFLLRFHPESLDPVTVREESTFSEVLGLMTANKVHRLFVVDSAKHPIGIVSMTDVCRWLHMLLGK